MIQPTINNVTPFIGGSSGGLIYVNSADALSMLAAASAGNALLSGTSPSWGKITSSHVDSSISVTGHTHAHSDITGLTSGDDHTQYALLSGRSGGQTLIGGTASGNDLTLHSTSHGTKGLIRFGTTGISVNQYGLIESHSNSDDGLVSINGAGYQNGLTKFRDLNISDGKGSSLFYIDGSERLITTCSMQFADNRSTGSWGTNGVMLIGKGYTFTDTTSSGTVATAYTNVFGQNTIAASSVTTFTDYITSYFIEPVAGTNVTFTNKWGIGADSLRVGTSNHLTVTNAGVLTCTSPVFTTPVLGVASATSLTSTIVYGGSGSGGNLSLTSTSHATKGNVVFNGTSYVSSTGVFFGDLNGTLTGNVIGSVTGSSGSCTGNAATVTTNANLTGPITSIGNATSIDSQTGTGTKFVMDTSPTLVTPNIGVASATSLACPTFTSSAAIEFTPAAGSGFNVSLSGAGDFAINTNQFVLDTSAGTVAVSTHSVTLDVSARMVVAAPNVNWGTALSLVADSVGRGFNIYSQDYNNSTTGVVASYNLGSNYAIIHVGASGSTVSGHLALLPYGGNVGAGGITAPTAVLHLGASTTARASLCIPAGTDPTSPVNGDIWYDGTNLKFRDGGTTRTLTWV